MVVEVRRSEQSLELDLTGEWRALELARIDAALAAIDLTGARRVVISTPRLGALDLSGAWRLRELIRAARAAGAEVTFAGSPPDQRRLIDQTLTEGAPGEPEAAVKESAGSEAPHHSLREPAIRP